MLFVLVEGEGPSRSNQVHVTEGRIVGIGVAEGGFRAPRDTFPVPERQQVPIAPLNGDRVETAPRLVAARRP